MSENPMTLFDILASLHDKQIISVIPTLEDDGALSELQFQFTDSTHLIVKGWGAGWEVDSFGVEITTDLARSWWQS